MSSSDGSIWNQSGSVSGLHTVGDGSGFGVTDLVSLVRSPNYWREEGREDGREKGKAGWISSNPKRLRQLHQQSLMNTHDRNRG